jgi:hypothetical protein
MLHPHHAAPTMAAKMTRNPISQRGLLRCLAGVDTGGGVVAGAFACPSDPVFCVSEDGRSGEPQRGQDLFVQFPRLEPHEVQYMSCFGEF